MAGNDLERRERVGRQDQSQPWAWGFSQRSDSDFQKMTPAALRVWPWGNQRLGADKQEEFISHGSEDWEDQAKQPARRPCLMRTGSWLVDSCLLAVSSWLKTAGNSRGLLRA